MPAPGDQHRSAPPDSTTANPFDPSLRRISQYTAQEIATLSSRLEKQLGPEYISSRPGAAGQKVHYVAAEKCINLANEVFGFNGWSSGIQNVQIDFVDESPSTGKINLGLSVIVRVTLRDGTYHEDIGYGHIENCKGKAAAFEKAKKEGTTDGLKRALRNFGNVLGNCIYDKEYLAKVTKVKVQPTRWTVDNLYRHQDYATVNPTTVKKESFDSMRSVGSRTICDPDDEFGDAEFDEVDFAEPRAGNPDEVVLETAATTTTTTHPTMATTASVSTTNLPPIPGYLSPEQQARAALSREQAIARAKARHLAQQQQSNLNPQRTHLQPQPQTPDRRPALPPPAQSHPTMNANESVNPPGPVPSMIPSGFVTARHAPLLQIDPNNSTTDTPTAMPSQPAIAFNPHAESPSIRKTSGIDHTKSKPIIRESLSLPSPSPSVAPHPNLTATNTTSALNLTIPPTLSTITPTPRIGMPPSPLGHLSNRSAYRPPGPAIQKRPLPHDSAEKATPLADIPGGTNRTVRAQIPAKSAIPLMIEEDSRSTHLDAKRQRLSSTTEE